MLGWDMSVGISVYGNGGMNTKYNASPFAALGGPNPAGVNLEQMFVAPTFAMKVNKNHALGVSIVMAYQTFGASGLQPFAGFSSNAASLTNKGNDHSVGWGLRLGWTGQVSDTVTPGATYHQDKGALTTIRDFRRRWPI
jgi:long-chain fatty acid transport protein